MREGLWDFGDGGFDACMSLVHQRAFLQLLDDPSPAHPVTSIHVGLMPNGLRREPTDRQFGGAWSVLFCHGPWKSRCQRYEGILARP